MMQERFGRVEDPTWGSALQKVYSPDMWRGCEFEEAFNKWFASVRSARAAGHEPPMEVVVDIVRSGMAECGQWELLKTVFSGGAYAEIQELEKAVRVSLAEEERRNLVRQEGASRQTGSVSAVKTDLESGRKKKFRKADRARKGKGPEARPARKGIGAVISSPHGEVLHETSGVQ